MIIGILKFKLSNMLVPFLLISLLILLGVLTYVVMACSYFLISKLETIMATQAQFDAVLERIETAVDKIVANQGNLPADAEDQILTRLEGTATKLEEFADQNEEPTDPEDPEDEAEQAAALRRNRSIQNR
jgi:hypothetical protein